MDDTRAESQAAHLLAEKKLASHTAITMLLVNIALTLFKLLAGIIGRSQAMISDAVHSASDVFGTLFVLIGVNVSRREADDSHPYGHERLECIVALVEAMILIVVAAGIAVSGVNSILHAEELAPPGLLALIAAVVSIVVKEWCYHYTMRRAKQLDSTALAANAWHHRSDALSSIGSLIGIGGAMLGFTVLDPIAALIICVMILKVAWDILRRSTGQLVDRSAPPEVVTEISRVLAEEQAVLRVDDMKTRLHGAKLYVDIEISVESGLTLMEAHSIAECVHDRIESLDPRVKHCMVHVNPYND